jgi:hypothetical protein
MKVGELLVQQLVRLGVTRVIGEVGLVGLPHLKVDDPDLACLLADADGRVGGGLGVALLAGQLLHISSQPGGRSPLVTVGSAEEMIAVFVNFRADTAPATMAVHLDLDLSDDVVAEGEGPPAERQVVLTLDESLADLNLAVVVGPGVVRAGATPGLLSLATAAGVAVLNTWGAKGVFRWDSPFHGGTIGLQERDVELAGIAEADVVIVSGLDDSELAIDELGNHTVQEVLPANLGSLLARWSRGTGEVSSRPPLYDLLARVVVPAYESEATPLTAARAALHLSGARPESGVVVADPGLAGFWVARAFPTGDPGSVVVPALAVDGFAAAASLLCAVDGRGCLAVTDRFDPVTEAIIDLAESMGVPATLQVWGERGIRGSTSDHVELCMSQLDSEIARIDDVAVDLSTDAIELVAGPIRPWRDVLDS